MINLIILNNNHAIKIIINTVLDLINLMILNNNHVIKIIINSVYYFFDKFNNFK